MEPMAIAVVAGLSLGLVALLVVLAKVGLGLLKLALVAVALALVWVGGYGGLRAYEVLRLDRRQQAIDAPGLPGWQGRALVLGFAPCIAGELAVRRLLGELREGAGEARERLDDLRDR